MTDDVAVLFSGELSVPPEQLSPAALAYLGDAVYSLFIRQQVLTKPLRVKDLHRRTTMWVSAQAQSKILHEIWYPILDDEELAVAKRGRNVRSGSVPTHAKIQDYRSSTAMECLIGYLYLKGRTERLRELMILSWEQVDSATQGKDEQDDGRA